MATELSVPAVPGERGKPISRTQIETVVSRSVGFAGLLFAAQTFPVMLGQLPLLHPWWVWIFNPAIFGGLLIGVIASLLRRFVRLANTFIAYGFLAAMVTWPLANLNPAAIAKDRPWLWFLCTIATAAAAIAFTRLWATVYLIAAPVAFGAVRLTPSGGAAPLDLAALDTVYAIILGGAVLVIVTMLRDAAASVDAAQAAALTRYENAVRQHATEVERVEVDSIVHDSVLTTLISAARAQTPEAMALSVTMANNAIEQLTSAAASTPDEEPLVAISEVAKRITDAAAALTALFTARVVEVGAGAVGSPVAEALVSATVQAMVNSLQHAGTAEGIKRWLHITGVGADGLQIEIGDTGRGFDAATVPSGRIGVSISIIERVTNVGGSAHIASQPGAGTVVSIRWPNDDPKAPEVAP